MQIAFLFWTYLVMDNPIKIQYVERTGGKRFMESWFHDNFNGDELLLLSETGYTNEEVTIEWLKHFIKHTSAGPKQPWKILLMDGHRTYESPEFVLLALANHIQPFEFPSHLTHVLQPLDVGVLR